MTEGYVEKIRTLTFVRNKIPLQECLMVKNRMRIHMDKYPPNWSRKAFKPSHLKSKSRVANVYESAVEFLKA